MNELAALRDIHVPASPGLWPPAPGWWLLAVLLLMLGTVLAWHGRRWRRHYRRRRAVLAQVAQLRADYARTGDAAPLAAGLSTLLRRVALARFPPTDVAGLTGADWLEFLDGTGGNGRFSQGPGRVLSTAPYAATAAVDGDALCMLAAEWIARNYGSAPVRRPASGGNRS